MWSAVSATQPSRQIVASVSTRDRIFAVTAGSAVNGSAMASAMSSRPSRVGPFGRGEYGTQEALALAHDASREPEQGGMQHQRNDGGADEDRGRDRPIGRRGQRNAESILHALDRVSQHGPMIPLKPESGRARTAE